MSNVLQGITLTRIGINTLLFLVGFTPKWVVINYTFFTGLDIIGRSGFIRGIGHNGKDMVFHHLVIMFGFPYILYHNEADIYGNLILPFEFSTVFYVLYGLTKKLWFKYLFVVFFFLFRVVYGFFMTREIYRKNPFFSALNLWFQIIYAIQLYWGFLLLANYFGLKKSTMS